MQGDRLAAQDLVAFVATRDQERAKAFYGSTLGLPLVSEDGFALVFDANGTHLRVTTVTQVNPAPYTTLGWRVPDLARAIQELRAAGVSFERYPGMPQDQQGIWLAPSGARVAWFKDPDGNTLSLTEW